MEENKEQQVEEETRRRRKSASPKGSTRRGSSSPKPSRRTSTDVAETESSPISETPKGGRWSSSKAQAKTNRKDGTKRQKRTDSSTGRQGSTPNLTTGQTVSCGCRNKENQSKVSTLKNDYVDGTSLSAVKASRKRNRNNTSGYTGVHLDKERGKWVAQIMLARKNHLIGRFGRRSDTIRARKEAEKEYFRKYRISE